MSPKLLKLAIVPMGIVAIAGISFLNTPKVSTDSNVDQLQLSQALDAQKAKDTDQDKKIADVTTKVAEVAQIVQVPVVQAEAAVVTAKPETAAVVTTQASTPQPQVVAAPVQPVAPVITSKDVFAKYQQLLKAGKSQLSCYSSYKINICNMATVTDNRRVFLVSMQWVQGTETFKNLLDGDKVITSAEALALLNSI